MIRYIGHNDSGQPFTLRGLLKSVCAELCASFRREIATETLNIDTDIDEQQTILSQLQQQVDEANSKGEQLVIGDEEFEKLAQLKASKLTINNVSDSLPDLVQEFHLVSQFVKGLQLIGIASIVRFCEATTACRFRRP